MTTSAQEKRKKGRSPLRPPRSAAEYALLALLRTGESHGYELTRRFADEPALRMICRLEMSMIYGLLKKLEKEQVITGRAQPVGESKTRRLVSLTESGRAEVEAWLSAPVHHTRELRLDFMVKLYFVAQTNSAQALALLDEQLRHHQDLLAFQKTAQAKLAQAGEKSFQWWVLEFRSQQVEAALSWLSAYKSFLTNSSPPETSVDIPSPPETFA